MNLLSMLGIRSAVVPNPTRACQRRRRSTNARLGLETLEGRETPANLTVTFSADTMTIVGDNDDSSVTIQGDAGDSTRFQLYSAGTINGGPSHVASPTGVKNIAIRLLDGEDTTVFGNVVPIDLQGSLFIHGGNGPNWVSATDLKVQKNVTIINGTNETGTDVIKLENLTVGGSVKISNGQGDTRTSILRSAAGFSAITGNLSISNLAGLDQNGIQDTHVGGNITVRNGRGDENGVAGFTTIRNIVNVLARSEIRGNVSVSYVNGDAFSDSIGDAEVLGNVTFNHGSGPSYTSLDGFVTTLPVIVRGSVTLKGTGASTIRTGTDWAKTGLIVGKTFTVISGNSVDFVTLNLLEVSGATRLALGNGNSNVTINDSVFAGRFTLTTGAGHDLVLIETGTGSSRPTLFARPVYIRQGAGVDFVGLTSNVDENQHVIILSPFTIYGGPGSDQSLWLGDHVDLPFGQLITWVD